MRLFGYSIAKVSSLGKAITTASIKVFNNFRGGRATS